MNVTPRVSIIIPTLNMSNLLKDTIDGIAKTCDETFEIIVVNQASVDDTKDYLDNLAEGILRQNVNFIRLITLHNPENRFWSTACNQGILNSSGEFVAFIANDMLVPPRFFSWATKLLTEKPEIGAVSPFYTEDPRLAGNFYSNYDRIPKLDEWTPGWHMAPFQICTRELLDKVGEWDEGMRTHVMDNDWGIRIELAGFTPTTWKSMICYHAYGSFGRKQLKLEKKMAKNDMRYFIKKWQKDVAQSNDYLPECIRKTGQIGNYISGKQKRQGFKWKPVEIIQNS